MRTVVTKRGQTVIPASLRRKYGIGGGTRLEWIDTGETLKVVPIPADVIRELRGAAAGEALTRKLLEERERDAARE